MNTPFSFEGKLDVIVFNRSPNFSFMEVTKGICISWESCEKTGKEGLEMTGAYDTLLTLLCFIEGPKNIIGLIMGASS